MNEKELFDHIIQLSERSPKGDQPPYAKIAIPVHPDDPIDYEVVRLDQYNKVLGENDFVFHPDLGAPHIDVYRYPPTEDRPFWVYLSNGMSDFPQLLPDGKKFRSELMLCAQEEHPSWPEIVKVLAEFPFDEATFIYYYHTIPLPPGKPDTVLEHGIITPPFLVSDLDVIMLGDEEVKIFAINSITENERDMAIKNGSQQLLDDLPDELETWLIDGRG